MTDTPPPAAPRQTDRWLEPGPTNVQVIYILYLAGLVIGISGLVAIVLAYINRGKSEAWIETHYTWAIRTFWISLAGFILGALLLIVGIGFVIWAEIRGEPTVRIFHRRLSPDNQRQALTVALLGVGLVVGATGVLLTVSPFRLDATLFEAISAFGTVGMSTGITADLPPVGQLVLIALMFLGRLGPITLGAALALRNRPRRFEVPTERLLVG